VSLARAESGAAMVPGLLFAVFLLAMVFYVFGTAEAVLFREHLQDAADAAAFSAAVVNARGMNLIALINLTMAALLAILVGLRLTETLCYVAIVLCGALAYPTAGASLSGIGPLTTAATKIHDAAEQLKDPLNQALSLLHSAGQAVAKVVPLGANLRVIDQTLSHYQALGAALPSRLTLPVEDDTFRVLCEHAGRNAGELAMLPISPVLPSSVESRLGDVAGKIVAAGPSWFCGGEGDPPDFNEAGDSQLQELPRTPARQQCEGFSAGGRVDPDADPVEVERVCTRASVERLAATPARDGSVRVGEPLCPTDCQRSRRPSCPPASVADCTPDESMRLERAGDRHLPAGGRAELFEQRAALARQQCRPLSAGGQGGLVGTWWVEREVSRTYGWHPALRRWVEDEAARQLGASVLVQRPADDDAQPCGRGGLVADTYELDASRPACRAIVSCGGHASGGPCAPYDPLPGASFRETAREVVHLLRCARRRAVSEVETPSMDLNEELGGEQQDQNTKPFQLEAGVYLGGSDFQLRAVVAAQSRELAEGAVAMASWGQEADATAGELAARALLPLGQVALSQAEFYFDWSALESDLDDETDEAHRTEWLWNMGWRARLRAFRLDHADADAEREESEQPEADAVACEPLRDLCDEARSVLALEREQE
jgi:hypothetical protein